MIGVWFDRNRANRQNLMTNSMEVPRKPLIERLVPLLVLQPGDGAKLVHGERGGVVRHDVYWGKGRRGRRRWGGRSHLLGGRSHLLGGHVVVVAADGLLLWRLRGGRRTLSVLGRGGLLGERGLLGGRGVGVH